MALTGTSVLVVLIVVAAAMPPAVAWAWPRVRGSRWLMHGQHVCLVLVAQFAALLLAGVALNDYGQFFSTWSQAFDAFFGSPPKSVLGAQGLGNDDIYGARSAPPLPLQQVIRVAPSDRLPAGWQPTTFAKPSAYAVRGEVATVTITGPTTELANRVAVYLPPAYFAGYRSLPLVEAITGYPSTSAALADKLKLPEHLLAGIRAHTMGQLVVVMAPAGLPYPLDTECTDAPGGPFAFTYFADDLPSAIEADLGLHPTGTGAMGYSTGGYCAVKLAMLDPNRFTAAVSMSGYFHAQPGRYSPNLFGGSRKLRHINDLRWRLQHLPAPRTSVLVMTGTEESGPDGWVNNNQFLTSVQAPMHAERFIVPVDFGHSYRTWAEEMTPALVWVSRTLGAIGGRGDLGSALYSRQGLHVHHHRDHRPTARPAPAETRPASTATAPDSPTASPSPSRTSSAASPTRSPP
jgi:hypothetical protein